MSSDSRFEQHGWLVLFVFGILLMLTTLVNITFESGPRQFELDTGVAWAEFSQTYPTIAAAYRLAQRLYQAGFFGLTLFALVITFFGLRRGYRWAWAALWILPGTLAVTTVLMLIFDQPGVAIVYGSGTIIALVGLLPIHGLFRRQ
jgi:hypothetical protein